jgi:hypothetical protein
VKRYFFHAAGAVTLHDIAGSLLADANAARLHAERRWHQLHRHHPADDVVIIVTDESGKALFEVTGERVVGR